MDQPRVPADARIGIVGLGYVGLPLAVEFGKHHDTVGFDINAARIAELRAGRDSTLEVDAAELASAPRLRFSSDLADLRDCNTYIVTVPTPIDSARRPDLTPLVKASEALGSVLKDGDVVIYESTVYPGCTEEICVPILERVSGLAYESDTPHPGALRAPVPLPAARGEGTAVPGERDSTSILRASGGRVTDSLLPAGGGEEERLRTTGSRDAARLSAGREGRARSEVPEGRMRGSSSASPPDHSRKEAAPQARTKGSFSCGYSPERINPGDKAHRVTSILKVTSGSTPDTADYVDALYNSIITAGTHKASSIKVAEAAKVIENTQRDLNIALVNDLAILFNKLGIDTLEVLEAAGTKWNFLPFRPGLVGGHCISVDPYYLTHKAQEVGHHPDVILAGRRTNDGMGAYVANETIRLMVRKRINPVHARVLVLGLAFKENCPDLRNTRVVDIVEALKGYNAQVDVHDPWVDAAEAQHEYGLSPIATPGQGAYDAIIIAVGHDQFRALGAEGIRAFGKPESILYDVKYVLPRDAVDGRL